ncbi:MAG: phosphoenolpyruvate carboxylase [Geminicoccaceae bacterium]|nr:phosphoenolpyruvate carboxylase [Geminicoccaceae bacterium]
MTLEQEPSVAIAAEPARAHAAPIADATLGALADLLSEARAAAERDPLANPIQRTACELAERLVGGPLDEPTLDRLVRRLTLEAFLGRAERLRAYLGEIDPEANAARIRELLRGIALASDGTAVPFEQFAAIVGRVHWGFVVTAHPTFALSERLGELLITLATGRERDGRPLDPGRRIALLTEVEAVPHRPEPVLDLALEHRRSMRALANLRAAIARVHEIALELARELWPERWTELVPTLLSTASWVGYDTDGRADIAWHTSLACRLTLQLDQLQRYAETVRGLRTGLPQGDPLASLLELVEARLALALKSCAEEREALGGGAGSPVAEAALARAAREMARGLAWRLRDSGELRALVDRCVAAARTPELQQRLLLLRAAIATHGLASARTHLRINALQVHNAVRKLVGLDHPPDDPTHRLSYLAAIARLIETVEPVQINFGSLVQEKATARRAFMIAAQLAKYLDAAEPIRFLIAECETPFTLLAALYLAELFGVADRLDITPLFETKKALERGVAILDEVLSVPAWRAHLERRGRICIQTGFSDAGRYLGQTAAAVAIERLRLGLVEVLARHGLGRLEVVIFDTHGESIGRGAHPESLAERFAYLDTPESRRRFAAAGLAVVQETSWQGGDGYLLLQSETSALAVVTRVLEQVLRSPEPGPDPFYSETAYVDEFFAAVRLFNERVIDDPAYSALLGFYGTNLLYPSGSRPVRRQFDAGIRPKLMDHPSQIRAIPHNAILQQLGVLANTIGGVGQAIAKDPDRFHRLYRDSRRFRSLVRMVEHAFMFTDLDVTRALAQRFDPAFWLARARAERDPAVIEELLAVAGHMERIGLFDRLAAILRVLERDHLALAAALREHRRKTREVGARPIAVDPGTRDNLHMLHALRLALIERIARTAVHVPDFSDRHEVTHDALVEALLRLEVEPALQLLGQIFPVLEHEREALDWGEPSTYAGDREQSYAQEHALIFRPMAADYDLVRRIGSAIVHHVGAFG